MFFSFSGFLVIFLAFFDISNIDLWVLFLFQSDNNNNANDMRVTDCNRIILFANHPSQSCPPEDGLRAKTKPGHRRRIAAGAFLALVLLHGQA
jgi:hypothetical protein